MLGIIAAILAPGTLLAHGPELATAVDDGVLDVGVQATNMAPVTDHATDGWAVQIGAYALAQTAQAQLSLILARQTDLLSGSAALVVPVDIRGGPPLFRARFGFFTRQEAEKLCGELQRRGETCLSVARAPISDMAAGVGSVRTALADRIEVLDDASLADMRGGFFLAGGAQFDFGASVHTLVNGRLAMESSVQWTSSGTTVQQAAGPGATPIPATQLAGLFGGGENPGLSGVAVHAPTGVTAVVNNLAAGQVQNVLLNTASNQTVMQDTNVLLTVYNLPQLQQQITQQLLAMRISNDATAAGPQLGR